MKRVLQVSINDFLLHYIVYIVHIHKSYILRAVPDSFIASREWCFSFFFSRRLKPANPEYFVSFHVFFIPVAWKQLLDSNLPLAKHIAIYIPLLYSSGVLQTWV